MKIAILGAGHGGMAMACDLSLAGHEVRLASLPEHAGCVPDIMHLNTVELIGKTGTGAAPGKVKISLITNDIPKAIQDAQAIMVVIPAFGQQAYMEILVEHIAPGQLVVFNPGKFASLLFSNMLEKAGKREGVLIGETISLIYATKIQRPGLVLIKAVKNTVDFAAMPARDTQKALKIINQFFPQFTAMENVLETSIADPAFIVHTTSTLMNASRIESQGSYPNAHYDITPGVSRVMEAMDAERMIIAMQLGIPTLSLVEACEAMYGVANTYTYYEAEMQITAHENQKSPSTLEHRYITEEVPYSLVPLVGIAKILGVKTPTFDAIITLASQANDEFYLITGRSAEKLGIAGMSKEEMLDYVL